MGVKDRC